jgi:hypothetical protein
MRAHYLTPQLLETLRTLPGLAGLVSVQVRVAPAKTTPANTPPKPQPLRLSGEATQCLADAADTVSDPKLRDSLRRLAARGRN